MRGTGSLKGFVAAVIAVAFVASSLGTAWTARTPSFSSHIDPSLRAGEVALVHTSGGHAGALSLKLSELGAVNVETEYAADTVIARLSSAALAAIATDPTVTVATRDIAVIALDSGRGNTGFEPSAQTGRDAADDATGTGGKGRTATSSGASASVLAIHAPRAWTQSNGDGITVAVMDTGIADHPDLRGKVRARVDFVHDGSTLADPGGHGTFIAGVIAANGGMKGVAPEASLVSLRVLDANGNGSLANVVKAFDWVLQRGRSTKVDVLNLSWGAPQATSYHKDILSALVEAAWFSGVTVVAATGNEGPAAGSVTAPASDPFVVSVGSFNDKGTASALDDVFSSFTGRGPTLDGFAKPDTLAPGEHVASLRAAGVTYLGADGSPIGSPTDLYIHMTGTSASAAFVSGVAALVAAAHGRYTPTKIKGAIVASARPILGSAAGAVDASSALVKTPASVNVGLTPSRLLLTLLTSGHQLKVHGVTWEGVTWDGVTWESVSWESISWETVSWETVTWEGVTWEDIVSVE
jgi:serine protease AprX